MTSEDRLKLYNLKTELFDLLVSRGHNLRVAKKVAKRSMVAVFVKIKNSTSLAPLDLKLEILAESEKFIASCKETKNQKRVERKAELKQYSAELNENLPKSEVWFKAYYKFFKHPRDEFNAPMGYYIPDVKNKQYRYVIEIDGSVHNRPDVIKNDILKDKFYKRCGFTVIRIIAYDMESLTLGLNKILRKRNSAVLHVKSTQPEFTYSYLPPVRTPGVIKSTPPKEKPIPPKHSVKPILRKRSN